MAVTVSIKTGQTSIERTGDSGFDEPTRIARVLRTVIEALEAMGPRRGLCLGDLIIIELGGHLGGDRSPLEMEPSPNALPLDTDLMAARRQQIIELLKDGPQRRSTLLDKTGLSPRQLLWAMDDPRFQNTSHGWWQLKPHESVA